MPHATRIASDPSSQRTFVELLSCVLCEGGDLRTLRAFAIAATSVTLDFT